jgi:hypothetical protein
MNYNITLDKFGIEYSYIAMAMNSMLGFTNNHVKNINVKGTYGIVIDYSWLCIVAIISLAASIGMMLLPGVGLIFCSMMIFWIYNGLFLAAGGTSIIGSLWGCF